MAVNLSDPSELHTVDGIRLGIASAGIKKPGRKDLTIIEISDGSQCAGVFTRNSFCAAPVTLTKKSLSTAIPKYLIINTGNANAGTGEQGVIDASRCCDELAKLTQCNSVDILPFSTGVIGEPLPIDKIISAMPRALEDLDSNNWSQAASAIMTTDTVAKGSSRKLEIGAKEIIITGIAKGSGMIRPDMATMLAFVATDAKIDKSTLQKCLDLTVNDSFNRITVDGDTSTNDACILMATAKSGVSIPDSGEIFELFVGQLSQVMQELAQAIIRDGEGATKFISIVVENGKDSDECLKVAYTVAHSPLVKTAFFASDPNWGRILAAVGRSGVEDLNIQQLEIYLNDVCIVNNGGRAEKYTEAQGQSVMEKDEITIRIILNRGDASETVWTSDLSHEYVRINAEYRT